MPRRVVVTGVGLVTPLVVGTEPTWTGLVAGRSGVGTITKFDASGYPVRIAAEVRGFEPADWIEAKEVKKFDLFVHYALAAARMALEQSGLEITEANATRVGVVIGSGIGGFPLIGMSWHQFIDHRDTTQGGDCHQFVTEIFHATTGTITITGTSSKITVTIGTFDTNNRHGFGIQEKISVADNTQFNQRKAAFTFASFHLRPPSLFWDLGTTEGEV